MTPSNVTVSGKSDQPCVLQTPSNGIISGKSDQPYVPGIREVTFNRTTTGLSIVIPAQINKQTCDAIIDSAAQVTVISENLFQSMKNKPQIQESVKLKGAGQSHHMTAKFARNVLLTLGDHTYKWDIYIAPISDDFILGLDFMLQHKAVVDLEKNTFTVNHQSIPAKLKRNQDGENFQVSRVFLTKKTVVPPNSVVIANTKFDHALTKPYILEPKEKHGILIPQIIGKEGSGGVICLLNDTDNFVTIQNDNPIGIAEEMDFVVQEDDDSENDDDDTSTLHLRNITVNEQPVQEAMERIKETVPEHLQDMFIRSCGNITFRQALVLADVLVEFGDVFAKSDLDLGCFDAIKHTIDTGDARPIKQRMRRTPLGFEKEEEKHLNAMLAAGVVQPSVSEWSSPPVLVRKKDGGVRWCIDYRSLNNVTRKDVFPLPLIEECIDTLSGTNYFSTLDMASGYWQVELAEEDRHKTAFITKYGLFEHTRMGFGLCNAPATFQRVVQLVLRGLTWKDVLAYLDDIIVVGANFEHHMHNLKEVFRRFRKHNLKLKPKKTILFQNQVKFLGKIVSGDGISINPDNISAVVKWPVPKNTKDVERFLGFVNYHRDHIPNYAHSAASLYGLTGKKPFEWTEVHDKAFHTLKEAMVSAPVLAYPKPEGLFILDTDASNDAIGAELIQIHDGEPKVICYGSFVLTPEQRRYCTTRKELLAVVRFTRQFRHYLLGRKFTVRTDHNSLTWLMRFKLIEGQLARWLEELSCYDMDIVHRPGVKHGNADGLSRMEEGLVYCNCYHAGSTPSQLPCGGCKYCVNAHKTWSRFEEEVDDVVPLAIRTIDIATSQDSVTHFWGPGYDRTQLRDEQMGDTDLRKIITWLEAKTEPTQAELSLSSPAVKYYWLHKKQLCMKGELLFYQWEEVGGQKLLFMVPVSLREEVLRSCHDVKSSGHLGQKKTLARLKMFFLWHGMSKHCQQYVMTCAVCSISKKASVKQKAPLGSYHAGAPMQRIHIDILGPLQESSLGNKYILMMVDQFTKWVECVPLPLQTAEMVAKAAIDGFLSRFGCPQEIHTDQGKNFDSDLFRRLCELLEITKTRTTPYRPCSNGQVERYNRTLLQLIRCYVSDAPNTWDQHLQQLTGAINSTVNRQTGFTRNKMMLGREVSLPVEIMLGTAELTIESIEPPDYVKKLEEVLHQTHEIARCNLQSTQLRQKRDYDSRLVVSKYQVGDLVYKVDSSTKVGQSSKLKPVWKGPLLITKVLSSVLFRIRDKRGESVIHHDRLKLCQDRAIPMWMRKMRQRFLSTGCPTPDPRNLLEGDSDLNLDLLFQDQVPVATSSGSKTSVATSGKKVVKKQPASDADSGIVSIPPIVKSRRSRAIKQPRYLDDYST